MSKLKELHELISTLTPAEKRYFRKMSSLFEATKDKQYILLFDTIDKHTSYNESILLKKFEKVGGNLSALPSLKNYLYKYLLYILHIKEMMKPNNHSIQDDIVKAKILDNKNLPRHTIKLLNKTLNKSLEENKYEETVGVFPVMYNNYLKASPIKDDIDKIRDLLKIQEKIHSDLHINYKIHQLRIIIILASLTNELYNIEKQNHIDNELHNLQVLVDKSPSLFLKYRFSHLYIWYYTYVHQHKKALNLLPNLERLYKQKNIKQEHFPMLLSLANIHMTFCLDTFKLNEFEKVYNYYLEFYKKINQSIPYHRLSEAKVIKCYICKGDYDNALYLYKKLESKWARKKMQINVTSNNVLKYDLAIIYYATSRYKDGSAIISELINTPKEHFRENIYQDTKILQLLTFYELEYWGLLENILPSTINYFKQKGIFKIHMITLKALKNLLLYNHSVLSNDFDNNLQQVKDILKIDGKERTSQSHLNLLAWFYSKKKKISFKDAVPIAVEELRGYATESC